ncbi:MAG TPA: TIM barrel protein, partial [Bacilli bacterium]|nr:TIM barrel protein [Bacilli bacterium]
EEEFLAALLPSFQRVYEKANASNLTLCLENTMNYHLPFLQTALQKLSCLEGFALTWDVGHDARSGHRDRETILRYVAHIRHLHVHQYDGRSDHLPLNMGGEVNLQETLALAQEQNLTWVLETKTEEALRQSCHWLHEQA